MAIRITLECGHASMLRVRTTPEGYTHDWEVFVRGVDGADISQYIEKVVFNLHETFPKPKRLLKEPPYIVKESGYAGFLIPITIYLKNKDEPKKIQIQYDLTLQHGGPAINNVIRHSEIFTNPADDFRRKLLKGGGVQVQNSEEGHDKSESKVSVPMVGKPKLSGSDGKKSHRPIEPRSEFADLFGVIPIKSTKVSPEAKKTTNDKTNYHKTTPDKIEKVDKSSKTKHSPHKDGKKEKVNDDNNKKEKKDKDSSKDKERSSKDRKRPLSPVSKNNYQSPSTKRSSSPPPLKKQQLSPPDTAAVTQKSVSPKIREKDHKKPSSSSSSSSSSEREKSKDKSKENPKIPIDELKSDNKKKKKHKDDKDSDRKERNRDKERERSKEIKITDKKSSEKPEKHDKLDKDKLIELKTSQKDDKKSPKQSKEIIDKQNSKIRTEKIETTTVEKSKDIKTDKERQKHKHRKKDKKEKRDESKERERREKKEKQKNSYTKDGTQTTSQQQSSQQQQQLQQQQQQPPPPPPQQQPQQQSVPIVAPPPAASSTLMAEVVDHDTSDSPNSGDDEPQQIEQKSLLNTNKTTDKDITKVSKSDSRLSRPLSPSVSSIPPKKDKIDKIKKEKLKLPKGEERENKKRKKRCDSKGDDEIPIKRHKDSSGFSPPLEPVSSSQSPVTIVERNNTAYTNTKDNDNNIETTTTTTTTAIKQNFETETEQIAPDSTNNILIGSENDEPLVFSDDYVSQLKDLQQKIMTLQDNDELQRVVQVIAATGQYEITRKTFDFDLCALDRRTVQRLQQFFSAS